MCDIALFVTQKLVKSSHKGFLDFLLPEIGCATRSIRVIFAVATPDITAVFCAAVPDLPAIIGSALAANDLSGKGTVFVQMPPPRTSAPDLVLDQLKGIRIDNSRV